ncbi:LuxR C-terminal-related transcriptional regulator [Paenibacillus sp. CMAA1364]
MKKCLQDYITNQSFISYGQFFELAILLTEMVHAEHKQKVVIGSFNPANLYITRNGQVARLSNKSDNNETYRSPEQSGRINRMPDNRSDLYVLGVILYELITGRLPLEPESDEAWDIVHISRMPTPLAEIRPDASGMLEKIIMKLLAKAPEDRYQSAYGLLDDLHQCEHIGVEGWKQPFEPGRRDRIQSLQFIDSRYGHSIAMEQLAEGVQQALQGNQAFRWIVGSEGIGKTTLVHRLQWETVRSGGRFIEGNSIQLQFPDFDQQNSLGQLMSTYKPILEALRQWIEQLWSDPPKAITALKEKLQAVYDHNDARTIVSLLPEAAPLLDVNVEEARMGFSEHIMDQSNPIAELLASMIRCFAANKPPLVLFVDCLESAEVGTYEVLKSLTAGKMTTGLLVIGVYQTVALQEDEIPFDVSPELCWLSDRWNRYPLERVLLLPLSYEEVRQVLAIAMHDSLARLDLFARVVYEHTGGNPRAIRLLLEGWVQTKQLNFDEKHHYWVWPNELVKYIHNPEFHLDFIEEAIAKVSVEAMEILTVAAVVGLSFQPPFLAELCGLTQEQLAHILQEALELGVIFADGEIQLGDTKENGYSFLNSTVHQMIYVSNQEKNPHWHRQIGLLLQQRQHTGLNDLNVSDAIDHLNLAVKVMDEPERQQLIEKNLYAAHQAIMDGRFTKGKQYAEAGLKLMHKEREETVSPLYLQLKLDLVWSEYMGGHIEQAQNLLLDLNEYSKNLNKVDRIKIWKPLIQFHTMMENETAVQYGKEALSEYGWKLSERASKATILKEVLHTRIILYKYRDKIHSMPMNHDEEYVVLCELMEQVLFPLLISDAGALIDLYARFIRYGLRKGMNEPLACIIGVYEQLVYRVIDSYSPIIPFATLEALQHFDGLRISFSYQMEFIGALSKQLEYSREANAYMVKAMCRGLNLNDVEFSNMAMITFLVTYNGEVQPLVNILDFFDSHMKHRSVDKLIQLVEVTRNYISSLQGESTIQQFIAIPESEYEIPDIDDEDNYICGCKLEIAYLFGNYREALYWVERCRATELGLDWVRNRKQRVYEMLSLTAIYPVLNATEQKRVRKIVRAQLGRMKSWKGFLGYNSAAYLLLKAECTHITSKPMEALHEYMSAVKQARDEKHGLMEGIACERLALCYQHDLVSHSGGMIAMMDACAAYSLWGIPSKAIQIRNQHADLLQPLSNLYGKSIVQGKQERKLELLDFPSKGEEEEILNSTKADVEEEQSKIIWQVINSVDKLEQRKWQESLLTTVLQHSGADRALLLRRFNDSFRVDSQLDMTVHEDLAIEQLHAIPYAKSVLRHSTVTNKAIVLDDALQSYFLEDEHINRYAPRSILCMPIAVPGDPQGILLYLENTRIAKVFTEQDVKLLELIAIRIIYSKLLEDEGTITNVIAEVAVAIDQHPFIEPLTHRELEMLTVLAEGLSNREISERFSIAETTVKTHTTRIYSKLGVKRRGQAVAKAKLLQIIE